MKSNTIEKLFKSEKNEAQKLRSDIADAYLRARKENASKLAKRI